MAVIAFIRRDSQPLYKIKKAAQAIWIARNGDTNFNLECIIDLNNVNPDLPMNEIILLAYGEVEQEKIVNENNLFLEGNFCDYLYDGQYERKSQDYVKLLVASNDCKYMKIAPINKIEVTPAGIYSRIRIFFSENLHCVNSLECKDIVKYAGFRIGYTIPQYSKRIKRHLYTEPTWTIDLRPYDNKVLGERAKNEVIVNLKLLYYWIVLPRGFFVTAFAPAINQIRTLEHEPWRLVFPSLEEDCICYSWKLEEPKEGQGQRLHLDFREPSFEPRWAFWAFLITAVALLITLIFFFFNGK